MVMIVKSLKGKVVQFGLLLQRVDCLSALFNFLKLF